MMSSVARPSRSIETRLRPPALAVALLLAIAGLFAAPLPARAASTVLLTGFENAASMTGVTLADRAQDRAGLATTFASEGSQSLRFDLAPTVSSSIFPRVWLADGTTLDRQDWTTFTYLQIGVVNAAPTPATLYIVVRDAAGKYLQRELPGGPYDYRVFQIATADIAAAGVDLHALQHIQVSTTRSAAPRVLYVDNVRLSSTPLDEAAERQAVFPQLAELAGINRGLDDIDRGLATARTELGDPSSPTHAAMQAQVDAIAAEVATIRASLDDLTVPEVPAVLATVQTLASRLARLQQVLLLRQSQPKGMFGLDSADSMSLVYPKDLTWASSGKEPVIGMARGETEHVQAVVVPYGIPLSQVKATIRGVTGPNGQATPSDRLSAAVAPVGSLFTTPSAAYRRPTYTGWTPDPIRTDLSVVDVPATDIQPFLVSVVSGAQAEPGTYRVQLSVTAAGQPEQRMSITVKVWPVTVQVKPELRTAFQFTPYLLWDLYKITDPAQREAMKIKYWDFLAAHKIQPDQIYTTATNPANPGPGDIKPQPVEDIVHIRDHYGLTQFTAMYLWAGLLNPSQPATWEAQFTAWMNQIDTAMAAYEAAGVADKAVIYGFDEARGPVLQAAKIIFQRIKAKYPNLPIMTTLRDDTFGINSGLRDQVDIWVPWVDGYRYDLAAQARAEGERVWWYHAISTSYPLPNWFNGYPTIDTRMLMGPMSHQADVEGILYYATNRWPLAERGSQLLVNDGILSAWNPATFFGTAGDGSLFYPGPNGPMSSLRLENVRDGLEDYNLMQELKRTIAAHPNAPGGLMGRAQAALSATDVVTDKTHFTENPATYRAWRNEVAQVTELLQTS